MGVHGLFNVLENDVPNGIISINILQEVQKWKRTNYNQQPIIVIDLINIAQAFIGDESLFCGRHQIIANDYEVFLKELVNADIHLAFFVDGAVHEDKRSKWLNRQNIDYERTCKLFNVLDETPCEEVMERSLPTITDWQTMIIDLSQQYGHFFHFSIDNNRIGEIASYAYQYNAVAVIAEDTDFLIYEGDWKFWSGKNLNTESPIITDEYNRSGLRQYLRLNEFQMPLFATMIGNDYIRVNALKTFHEKISASKDTKFTRIADYVVQLIPSKDSLSKDDLEYIAVDIMEINYENAFELVMKSLNSYKIDQLNIYTEPYDALLQLLKKEDMINEYTLVLGIPQAIVLSYFVFQSDFMSYTKMVLPIEERIAGVILTFKNNPLIEIDFYAKLSHEEHYKMIKVRPVYPTFISPPIIDLISDGSPVSKSIRWKVFFWMISVHNLSYPPYSQIPEKYTPTILALYFLVKLEQISIKEADTILLTISRATNDEIPDDIDYPDYVSSRIITICHLYCKIHEKINRCLKICGLSDLETDILFDGVFFCNSMLDFKHRDRKSKLRNISHLRIYA